MKRSPVILLLAISITTISCYAQRVPPKKKVLETMRTVNGYFMNKWPDPGKTIVTNRERPSNIWTRAVYYEGLMALYALDSQKKYYDYAVDWGTKHNWGMRSGVYTRNADDFKDIGGLVEIVAIG